MAAVSEHHQVLIQGHCNPSQIEILVFNGRRQSDETKRCGEQRTT